MYWLIALHHNEAQKLSSAYNILPGQSRNIDIKRAVWPSFVRLFTIWLLVIWFYCFSVCVCMFIFRMFSSCLFYSFVFYVCLCCVLFLYFILVQRMIDWQWYNKKTCKRSYGPCDCVCACVSGLQYSCHFCRRGWWIDGCCIIFGISQLLHTYLKDQKRFVLSRPWCESAAL